MPPLVVARLRFFALCVAVCTHVAALAAVTVHSLKLLQHGSYAQYIPGTLAAWLGLATLPALILSPFIGPLVGARANRVVLLGGSLVLTVALAWAVGDPDVPWLSVIGLLSLNAAAFAAAVLVILPVLTAAAGLQPVTGRLMTALAATAGIGLIFAGLFGGPKAALVLAVVSLAAVPAMFPRIPEPVLLSQGLVRPFLAGARDAFGHFRGRTALLGLWAWFFVALTVVVALLRIDNPGPTEEPYQTATRDFLLAIGLGILLTGFCRHSFRHGGYVMYAAVMALICCLWWRMGESVRWPVLGLGFALGMALPPLLHFYQTWTTPKHHGVGAALAVAGGCIAALVLAVILVNLGNDPLAARTPLLNILVGVTAVTSLGAVVAFFRPALEISAEVFFWVVYRIRGTGPALDTLPARGPYLVIANHAAWFDPLFLAKVVPPPIVPMMTSKFYDLPMIAWIMRHVTGTIRVPESPMRHAAPELKEAVAALDRGECVVLFPEGYLRRKEEQPLRRFGRGVWQILADRPGTPVYACWIDGNWGSFCSYQGGPPTKNKRIDFWRRIRIGVVGPIPIDPAILADHMTTRTYLMRQVAAARAPLGLPPLDLPTAGEGEKE